MKFNTVAIASLAASAFAAPAAQPQSAATKGMEPFTGKARGTIDCNVDTKRCTVACGPTFQSLCTLVGVFDSAFYGFGVLVGFSVNCSEKGCNVYCPVDGTALCTVNEAGAAFASVFAVGETIVIDGVLDFLEGLGPLTQVAAPTA